MANNAVGKLTQCGTISNKMLINLTLFCFLLTAKLLWVLGKYYLLNIPLRALKSFIYNSFKVIAITKGNCNINSDFFYHTTALYYIYKFILIYEKWKFLVKSSFFQLLKVCLLNKKRNLMACLNLDLNAFAW